MIWCVGHPLHDLAQWGQVLIVPPCYSDDGKRPGIATAMRHAVEMMNLGDVVCQNDVYFTKNPLHAPAAFGTVRTFVAPRSNQHLCPQAFAIYDEPTRRAVLDAWTPAAWACRDWRHVPWTSDILCAVHDREML